VTTPTQDETNDAVRELKNAYREYLNSLPSIATHERAALAQRKAAAWNSLETARTRDEDRQERGDA
jgi:hypothetical protein